MSSEAPTEQPPAGAPAPRSDAEGPGPAAAEIVREPEAAALGRLAHTPGEIPWRGWKAVLRRTFNEMISDRISLVSAGCAFYATLALFPAISMLVSIYGLAFDPSTVLPQLEVMRNLLPPAGYAMVADRITQLVSQPAGTLGWGLVISTALTLWSASAGTRSILSALNLAYEEPEARSFLRYHLTALGMTLCAIVGAVLGLALLVLVPAVLAFLGVSENQKGLARLAGLGLMLLFVMAALSLLYRFGPSRRTAKWHWVTPGSLLATAIWLVASALFSFYVGHFASYDATYGPLGAVVGVMTWFWVSVFVVLAGAELNSELELQTARDSTEGPAKPMGSRGAYVADHVAQD